MTSRIGARLVVSFLLLGGCGDAANNEKPAYQQSLGEATGIFSDVAPEEVLCLLSTIGTTTFDLTVLRTTDGLQFTVGLPPLRPRHLRIQTTALFDVMGPDHVAAFAEYERGASVADPRNTPESPFTARYIPLYVHRLVVDPVTLEDDEGRSVDVPASSMTDAFFWCEIIDNVTQPDLMD